MKKNNQKRIIMGLALIVLVVIIGFAGKSLATPNSQAKVKEVKGLTFENATVEYRDNLSYFSVDVYNETKKAYKVSSVDIVFKNKEGSTITLTQDIDNLESQEGRKIVIERIDYDLRDYNDISYKINK